jgi:hypothetical protein
VTATSLSSAQVDQFVRDGFVVVPGVVDEERVGAALQAINHWLSTGFDRDRWATYDQRTFAPELTGDPQMLGLLCDTEGLALATSLVGRPLVTPSYVQLALRFPAAPGEPGRTPGAHIDGLPSSANGVPADGRIYGFTLLAGVLLSDLWDEGHGNLTVFPGTHRHMAAWFAENGTHFRDASVVYQANARIAAEQSSPVAVCGRAGDLVLAHYLLLHGVGRHAGPNIRYAAFFRLNSEDRESLGDRVFTDVWAEWPGVASHGAQPRAASG